GAGGTQNLPGAQLAIPDPGENGVLHTFLACIEAQLANFVTFRFQMDVASSGGTTIAPPTVRAVSANGPTATSDLTQIPMQGSTVIDSGSAHTVDVQGLWETAGSSTFARDRGNSAHSPGRVLAIRWSQAPSSGVSGSLGVTLPAPTSDIAA